MSGTLLACEGARIDRGGAMVVDGLSCSSSADRLGLIGDWSALFRLLGSEAHLDSGVVRVHGKDASLAVRDGIVGLACCDPPLPTNLRAADYLVTSALLSGFGRADARREATGALERLGLAALGSRRIAQLNPPERRALLLAHALIGNPPVLALETPLAGLDDWAGAWLLELVFRAAFQQRLLISVAAVVPTGAERALIERVDELMIFGAGALIRQGPPAEALRPASRFVVTVLRQAPSLAKRLSENGAVVHTTRPSGALEQLTRDGLAEVGESARLLVELPPGAAADLVLHAALEADAPVIELVPHAP